MDRAEFEMLTDRIAAKVHASLNPHFADRLPIFLDRQAMAEALNLSLPTLDRLVSSGEIPSLRVGTRRLFEPDAVVAALKQSK